MLQLMRVLLMWPIGQWLHDVLEPFLDARDSGPLVLTHLYLLLGFSIPVWLYPLSYSGGMYTCRVLAWGPPSFITVASQITIEGVGAM